MFLMKLQRIWISPFQFDESSSCFLPIIGWMFRWEALRRETFSNSSFHGTKTIIIYYLPVTFFNIIFFKHHLASPSIQPISIHPDFSNSPETKFKPGLVYVRRNTLGSYGNRQLPPEPPRVIDHDPLVLPKSTHPTHPPDLISPSFDHLSYSTVV